MYDFSKVDLHQFDDDETKRLITNKLGRQYWVWAKDALYLQRFGSGCPPYQSRNLKFLRACCPDSPKAIDIGMNVGNNTMEYATWCREVHSFEPFPSTFALGECSIATNLGKSYKGRYYGDNDTNGAYTQDEDFPMGWWKEDGGIFAPTEITGDIYINHCGLGEERAIMLMEDHPNNAGHNCIVPDKRKHKDTYVKHEVSVKLLDDFTFEDVGFIKVDVEGYEFKVLQGGIETIKKSRPVVQLEIVEKQCKDFQYTPQDLYDFFIKEIGDYVACDYAGNDLGPEWKFLKRCMDHFFVPREVFNNIDRAALFRNVGRGNEFHKQREEEKKGESSFDNLFG